MDLTTLLRVQHTSVVASVDTLSLETLLKTLLAAKDEAQLRQQQTAATLAELNRRLQQLEAGQLDRLAQEASPATQQDAAAQVAAAGSCPEANIAQLTDSAQCSAQQQLECNSAAEAAQAAACAAAQAADAAAEVAHAAARESRAAKQQLAELAASTEDLSKQLNKVSERLAGKADAGLLQGLSDRLSSNGEDLSKQLNRVFERLAGKADAGLLQGLSDRLSSNGEAVEHLRRQLADKADRSELDLVLNGIGAGSTAAPSVASAGANCAGATPPAATEVIAAEPGSEVADAAAVAGTTAALSGQVSRLQLQLMMLQERLGKKADGAVVAELSDGLGSTKTELTQLSWQLQQLNTYLTSAKQQLTDVQQAVKAHTHDKALHQPQASQLELVLGRLSNLESQQQASLGPDAAAGRHRGLAQPAQAATAGERGIHDDGPLAELQVAVGALQAQVAGLQQSRAALAAGGLPAAAIAAAGVLPPGTAAGSAAGDEPSRQVLDAAESAAGLLADVSERLAALQLTVESQAAAKADRGDLEQLRAMLADTATQSDADLLHHKLDGLQQQLDRSAAACQQGSGGGASGSTPCSPHCEPSLCMPSNGALRPSGLSSFVSLGSGGGEPASPGAMGLPSPAGGVRGAGGSPWARPAGPGSSEPQQQQLALEQLAGLEQLAQAVCLLAAGQAAAGGNMDSGGLADGSSGPHTVRLRRLLQAGAVGRKLDYFDPALLQKMAQRLAAAEARINMAPQAAAMSSGGRPADLEARVRRLAGEVRLLRERLTAASSAGLAVGGDHTMLAAKPLGGYRCMACDRPLAGLDATAGPHMPSGALPVSLPPSGSQSDAPAAAKQLPPAGSRRATAQDAAAAAAAVYGPPADQLPNSDVGPKLPPGGWRGLPSREDEASAMLPALMTPVARGGGTPLSARGLVSATAVQK